MCEFVCLFFIHVSSKQEYVITGASSAYYLPFLGKFPRYIIISITLFFSTSYPK